jgi:ribosome-binding factor A
MARDKGLKNLRLGEDIKYILSTLLARGSIKEPLLAQTPITITEVRLSSDSSFAKVFIMPLGGRDSDNILQGLNKAKGFIRRELGKRLKSRLTPELAFKIDDSFEYSSKIETLLHDPKVAKDLLVENNEEE